jgi:hypothetical protein
MKKLIAISVMCALVAGAAFAETSVGGGVFVGAALFQGDSKNDSRVTTPSIENDRYNTALKITFTEGDAGGRIRILGNNVNGSDAFDEWFGWWRPIPQLRIQFGSNQDGDFGNAQISGWGFTGENKNSGGNGGAMAEYNGYNEGRNHSRTVGWYGGTGGTPNLQFTINAIENLTINLWIPFNSGGKAAGFTFFKTNLNLQYRLPDIGNITLSFEGNTGYLEGDADKWYGEDGVTDVTQSPKIFASFYLTAIENMGVDLGLAYKFPFKNTVTETTTNHPFEIGLGFRYNISADFSVKLRASFSLGANTVTGDADPVKEPLQISASVLPSYKIGTVTVFFYAGLGIQAVEDWEKEKGGIFTNSGKNAVVAWFINPYVFIPAGNLRFKVGLQIYSDGVGYPYYQSGTLKYDNPLIKWSIPVGFYCYF